MTTLNFLHFFFLFFVAVDPTSFCSSSMIFFDVKGSVYDKGVFHAVMKVGDPAEEYHLTLDTGSSLTWLECKDANPEAPERAYDPEESKFVKKYSPKSKSMERCRYSVRYMDGFYTEGCLVIDDFHLFDAYSRSSEPIVPVALEFGCGTLRSDREDEPATEGLLGVGPGSNSISNQMKEKGIIKENMIGHRLSSKGTGYGFIGSVGLLPLSYHTVWLQMDTSRKSRYVGGAVTIVLDGHPARKFKYQDIIFDSGTTYTLFTTSFYDSTVEMVKTSLETSPLTFYGPMGELFHHCWEGQEPIYRVGQVRSYFKPIKMVFRDGQIITLEPEDYLQIIPQWGMVCLGIMDAEKFGFSAGENIIEDISMMDKLVVHDNERRRIGWDKHVDCQNSYVV